VRGQPPFQQPEPISALARLYDNYTHLVVDARAPVKHLPELKGHVVATGAAGSGTELMAERLLALAKLDTKTDITQRVMSLNDSVTAMQSGQIDAFFWSGGLPTDAVTTLAKSMPIRLISLAEYVQPLRENYGELFTEVTIPASTYYLGDPTTTIGVPNLLVVN